MSTNREPATPIQPVSRREWLQEAAVLGGAAALTTAAADAADAEYQPRGNINHSIVRWCFNDHYDIRQLCQVAKQLGCKSVEIVEPADWAVLKEFQLDCAIA